MPVWRQLIEWVKVVLYLSAAIFVWFNPHYFALAITYQRIFAISLLAMAALKFFLVLGKLKKKVTR